MPLVCLALLAALLVSPLAHGAAAPAIPPPRFTFAALGCMPYGPQHYAAYERLLAEIDRHAPAFVVHCGDTWAAAEPPTDEALRRVRGWFDALDGPVVYTPGDNEWTDVHRHGRDPLEWLAKIRTTFFTEERSLGRNPMPLVTQRRDPAHARHVENARWSKEGVVFATLHMVGSNNNRDAARPAALEEFRARDAANVAWLRATFAAARESGAPAVVLFFQAQPFARTPTDGETGYTAFLAAFAAEAKAFGKPVLLVHADEHRYRLESGARIQSFDATLENVTRLETFGGPDIHGVLVTVDAASPQVFLAGPLLVPGNPLPALPRQ